jgi:hypothetical protein
LCGRALRRCIEARIESGTGSDWNCFSQSRSERAAAVE